MPQRQGTRERRCDRCDRVFASVMRLQHHWAAEHALKTLKDICTMRGLHTNQDIPHRPVARTQAAPWPRGL